MLSRSKSITLQRQFALTADGYRLLHEESWEDLELTAYLSHLRNDKRSSLKLRKPHTKAKDFGKVLNIGRWCLKCKDDTIIGFIEVEISGGRYTRGFIYGFFTRHKENAEIIREALYSVATILVMIEGCSVFHIFSPKNNLSEISASPNHMNLCLSKNRTSEGLTLVSEEVYLKFDETDLRECDLGQILFKKLSYFEKRKKRLGKVFS